MIYLLALMVVAVVVFVGMVDPERADGQSIRNARVQRRLAHQGRRIDEAQARELEHAVNADPEKIDARTSLLGFYMGRQRKSKSDMIARQGHILWLIENQPGADVLGSPEGQLLACDDATIYATARALWWKQMDAHPNDLAVLENAARQFLLSDDQDAESLLRRGQVMEPRNGKWSQQLAQLYKLRMVHLEGEVRQGCAEQALAEFENAYSLATSDPERTSLLVGLAKSAFEAGQFTKAKLYATQLAEIGARGPSAKEGNAIHHSHLILGRLALHEGDVAAAKLQLHAAGETPGAPNLNSFGPNMTLARDLLKLGETEAVLHYFAQCDKFWKLGEARLEAWTQEARSGIVPDFGPNLIY